MGSYVVLHEQLGKSTWVYIPNPRFTEIEMENLREMFNNPMDFLTYQRSFWTRFEREFSSMSWEREHSLIHSTWPDVLRSYLANKPVQLIEITCNKCNTRNECYNMVIIHWRFYCFSCIMMI